MNRAERFANVKVFLLDAGTRAPEYGPGLGAVDLGWRTHLVPTTDAREAMHELCAVVRLEPPLSLDEATEAVRRLLVTLNPLRPASKDGYWCFNDCRSIASSLLAELPSYRTRASQEPATRRLEPWPEPPPPYVPTPRWLQISQMVGNATAAAAMQLFSHSRVLRSPSAELRVYDSDPDRRRHGHRTPMLLIHGMFTTAVSMGVLAYMLSQTRRVVVIDLPDFDYGIQYFYPAPLTNRCSAFAFTLCS